MNEDDIPGKAPQPSTKPKKYYNLNRNTLDLTPEKLSVVKVINEGAPKKQTCLCNARKSVKFQENQVKDMNGIPEFLSNDNLFTKPSMNSTKSIINKIEVIENKNFNLGRTLKELKTNNNIINDALSDQSKDLINYKLSDRKFKDLISIEVDENDPDLQIHKKKYKQKKKEQLDPFDLWFKDDFIAEHPCLDFEINDVDNDDDKLINESKDKFDYLFDLYKHNEITPFQ